MDCRKAKKLIDAFVDDELEAQVSYEVDRHLAACAPCRAEAEWLRALDGRVREACCQGAHVAGAASEALRGKVLGALDAEIAASAVRRRRGVFARRGLAAAAVLLIAAVLGIGLLPGPAAAAFIEDHRHRPCAGGQIVDVTALRALCEAAAGAHVIDLCSEGYTTPRAAICEVEGKRYIHLFYECTGRGAVSIFVRRPLGGLAGRLLPNGVEHAGDYDVVRVRCPAGTEYVAILPPREAESLRGLIVAQVGAE